MSDRKLESLVGDDAVQYLRYFIICSNVSNKNLL